MYFAIYSIGCRYRYGQLCDPSTPPGLIPGADYRLLLSTRGWPIYAGQKCTHHALVDNMHLYSPCTCRHHAPVLMMHLQAPHISTHHVPAFTIHWHLSCTCTRHAPAPTMHLHSLYVDGNRQAPALTMRLHCLLILRARCPLVRYTLVTSLATILATSATVCEGSYRIVHVSSPFYNLDADWLERSPLILNVLGSKRCLRAGFFNKSLCSPSRKGIPDSLELGLKAGRRRSYLSYTVAVGSLTATSRWPFMAMGQPLLSWSIGISESSWDWRLFFLGGATRLFGTSWTVYKAAHVTSQGKIPWNTLTWSGIELGPQGGQTVSYPTELSWLLRYCEPRVNK